MAHENDAATDDNETAGLNSADLSSLEAPKPVVLSKRAAMMQIAMAFLANITIISSGIGLGYPAVTLFALKNETNPMALTETEASWFASVNAITCPFGGLLAGILLEKIGRKHTLVSINIVSIISWVILAFSSKTNKTLMFYELILARVIIGFGIGMSSSPAAVYSAEISHPDLRGRLTLFSALFTALGMLFIYTLGYLIPNNFRLVSLISAIFTCFSLLSLVPLPESPTWLLGRNRIVEAENSLCIVRGIKKNHINYYHIEIELQQLMDNLKKSRAQSAKHSIWQIIKRPEVYKSIIIMIFFFFFQQFSGTFVIMVYGATFVSNFNSNIDPLFCTVLIGLTRVLTTIAMGFLSDKYGRRPMGMLSGVGMSLCMFGLAFYTTQTSSAVKFQYLPATLLIGFIFFATLGLLTLPFAMIAEVFPQQYRGFCAGITIFACYTMSFVIIKLYPFMLHFMGITDLFIFYGSISFAGVLYVAFILPETKGLTLQAIEERFRRKANTSGPREIERRETPA